MAKFDLLTSSTTIKTIDAVLNKIDDKLRDETVKNDANQVAAFKQLRQKYDDRKIMIISIYQRSVKKNITLQGIEKSTLSLDLLKKYGLKGKVTRAQTFNAIGSALNNKKLKTGITGSLIAGSALRVLNQTNAFGAEGWFTSKVAPKMLEGLKTLTGIGVNPASTFFGAAAIGAGVLLAVGYGMKKWQEKERARVTAQNEVEEAVVDAEKEVRGLVSTDFKNFANSDKINEIAEEIANDPQLKSRVAALLKSKAPAVTQEMKTNISAALSLAEDKQIENRQKEAQHRLDTAIYSVDKEKLNNYTAAAIECEKLTEISELVSYCGDLGITDIVTTSENKPLHPAFGDTATDAIAHEADLTNTFNWIESTLDEDLNFDFGEFESTFASGEFSDSTVPTRSEVVSKLKEHAEGYKKHLVAAYTTDIMTAYNEGKTPEAQVNAGNISDKVAVAQENETQAFESVYSDFQKADMGKVWESLKHPVRLLKSAIAAPFKAIAHPIKTAKAVPGAVVKAGKSTINYLSVREQRAAGIEADKSDLTIEEIKDHIKSTSLAHVVEAEKARQAARTASGPSHS